MKRIAGFGSRNGSHVGGVEDIIGSLKIHGNVLAAIALDSSRNCCPSPNPSSSLLWYAPDVIKRPVISDVPDRCAPRTMTPGVCFSRRLLSFCIRSGGW